MYNDVQNSTFELLNFLFFVVSFHFMQQVNTSSLLLYYNKYKNTLSFEHKVSVMQMVSSKNKSIILLISIFEYLAMV